MKVLGNKIGLQWVLKQSEVGNCWNCFLWFWVGWLLFIFLTASNKEEGVHSKTEVFNNNIAANILFFDLFQVSILIFQVYCNIKCKAHILSAEILLFFFLRICFGKYVVFFSWQCISKNVGPGKTEKVPKPNAFLIKELTVSTFFFILLLVMESMST